MSISFHDDWKSTSSSNHAGMRDNRSCMFGSRSNYEESQIMGDGREVFVLISKKYVSLYNSIYTKIQSSTVASRGFKISLNTTLFYF